MAVDRCGRLDAIEEAMRHRRRCAWPAAHAEAELGEVGSVRVDDRLQQPGTHVICGKATSRQRDQS